MKSFHCLIFILLLTFSFAIKKAKADWYWDAFQITCSKDLNYFSIRTTSFADLEPENSEVAKRLEREKGIYGVFSDGRIGENAGISKHPYTCNLPSFKPISGMMSGNETLPARKIIVELGNDSKALCRIAIVRVNDIEVARFPANVSECGELGPHLIELDTFNHLTDCTLSSGDIGSSNGCHTALIKQ